MENYVSFTLDNLRFIDSHHFMNAPLSTLVKNLSEMGDDERFYCKETSLSLVFRFINWFETGLKLVHWFVFCNK